MEDIIIPRFAAVSYLAVPEIITSSCGLMMLCLKVVGFVFFVDTLLN